MQQQVNYGKKADTVPENYRAGNPDDDFWAAGVIEQVHKTCVPIYLHKGFNEVQIELLSKIPAVEKIIFYREGTTPGSHVWVLQKAGRDSAGCLRHDMV